MMGRRSIGRTRPRPQDCPASERLGHRRHPVPGRRRRTGCTRTERRVAAQARGRLLTLGAASLLAASLAVRRSRRRRPTCSRSPRPRTSPRGTRSSRSPPRRSTWPTSTSRCCGSTARMRAEPFTPALATDWAVSEDGLTWTFHLREGVTFHDGEPLTADAVVACIEAAKERAGASFIWVPLDIVTRGRSAHRGDEAHLRGAHGPRRRAPLYGAWIVSPKALEAAAADETYFEAGVDGGTGPYTHRVLHARQRGPAQRRTRTTGAAGMTSTTTTRCWSRSCRRPSTSSRRSTAATSTSRSRVPAREHRQLPQANPDFTVVEEPSFFNYVGLFNTGKAPLDDPKVRQALAYAIPYDDIITVGAQGFGTQSRGPVPAGVFPYDESVPQYTTDIEKAKALLARGRPRGRRLPDGDHLRRREPERGPLRAAARRTRSGSWASTSRSPRCPSTSSGSAPRATPPGARTCSCCSTGRPTRTPVRTTCGRCSTAARRPSSTSPTGSTRPIDGLIDEAGALTAHRPGRRAGQVHRGA